MTEPTAKRVRSLYPPGTPELPVVSASNHTELATAGKSLYRLFSKYVAGVDVAPRTFQAAVDAHRKGHTGTCVKGCGCVSHGERLTKGIEFATNAGELTTLLQTNKAVLNQALPLGDGSRGAMMQLGLALKEDLQKLRENCGARARPSAHARARPPPRARPRAISADRAPPRPRPRAAQCPSRSRARSPRRAPRPRRRTPRLRKRPRLGARRARRRRPRRTRPSRRPSRRRRGVRPSRARQPPRSWTRSSTTASRTRRRSTCEPTGLRRRGARCSPCSTSSAAR